jgi:hypothetical protein
MHPLLDPPKTGRYNKHHFIQSPWVDDAGGRLAATGSTVNITVRAVCDPCNNGWMNRLEGLARPLLEPLVTGSPVAFDSEQMQLIADWITMKVMVLEHALVDTAVTTRYYRQMFRFKREIPHFYRIYLASHDLPPVALLRRDARCLAYNSPVPSPPLGGVSKNMESIVFVIGKVFAVIHAVRVDGLQIEDKVAIPELYETSRIWPPDHMELVWPRKPFFTSKQIDKIGACFERLDKSVGRISWIKDVPGSW